MQNIQNANINNKTKVFVRLDLDVPIENGKILETFRLDAGIKTIKHIIDKGGFPILAGHMDKPEGKIIEKYSTKQLLPYFEEQLGTTDFELLENLRFDPREEENSLDFAKELAAKADIYVNESFATSHRNHASIVGIPKLLPSYAGFRLQREISVLEKLKVEPLRPLVVIVGGVKIEDKKPMVLAFLDVADFVLVGGKIGENWGDKVPSNVHLPLDYAKDHKDIGPKTIQQYKNVIAEAKTILWAGPMGLFEEKEFSFGTKGIIEAIVDNEDAWCVVGGGDTSSAINKLNSIQNFNFVSTGGGAMLKFLAEGKLPGIEVLNG